MSEPTPTLSVVIPAFNESARLGPTLGAIGYYLRDAIPDHEILVVDDGSTDDTVDVAGGYEGVRVIELGENRGKGAAVRAGMLAARGDLVLFSDADLATPIEELTKLRAAVEAGADIAIASRALPDSDIRVRQHPVRELMGRTFNLMVRTLAGIDNLRDTQCGFKLFTRAAAQDLFSRATVDGFAFDVELLLLARDRYRIAEVPVTWRHVEASKVSALTDAARMARDVIRLRWRLRR